MGELLLVSHPFLCVNLCYLVGAQLLTVKAQYVMMVKYNLVEL